MFFTYSFADYRNPHQLMGFGVLRMVNDDTVLPESGFPFHYHEQMEIVTIMLGERDSVEIGEESHVAAQSLEDADVLLIELPME